MAQFTPRVQAALGKHGLSVELLKTARAESGWTEARMAVLTALITEEFTGLAASDVLGGVTRASVTGKMQRMGLSHGLSAAEVLAKAETARRRNKEAMQKKRAGERGHAYAAPVRPVSPPPPQPLFAPREAPSFAPQIAGPVGGVSLMALGDSDCRFPLLEIAPGDFHTEQQFCGAPHGEPRGGELPYCDKHRKRCSGGPAKMAVTQRRAGTAVMPFGRGRCDTVMGRGQTKGMARA